MNSNAKKAYWAEIKLSRSAMSDRDIYHHLGRAHIISQLDPIAHFYTHLLMMKFALKKRDMKEILGQALRLLGTFPGHLLGRIPWGNIGWSSVGIVEPMPIPDDLKYLFKNQ